MLVCTHCHRIYKTEHFKWDERGEYCCPSPYCWDGDLQEVEDHMVDLFLRFMRNGIVLRSCGIGDIWDRHYQPGIMFNLEAYESPFFFYS